MSAAIQQWALMIEEADRLARQAACMRQEAILNRRCPVTDSGGAQCTRDRHPEAGQQHRIEQDDLPSGWSVGE